MMDATLFERLSAAALLDHGMPSLEINFRGEGLTLGEIAAAGGFGVWAERDDIADSVAYAEMLRQTAEKCG